MVDYKEILRLSQQYYSLRQIAASVCHSHHTVKNVLDLAAQHGIEWPLDDDITNAELEKLFHPDKKGAGIRTIATLLKNSHEPEKSVGQKESGSKYGITRGAAYWKKGGGGNAE